VKYRRLERVKRGSSSIKIGLGKRNLELFKRKRPLRKGCPSLDSIFSKRAQISSSAEGTVLVFQAEVQWEMKCDVKERRRSANRTISRLLATSVSGE